MARKALLVGMIVCSMLMLVGFNSSALYQTDDIFLKELQATTVLLVRHAEPDYENKDPYDPDYKREDPHLNTDGRARAQQLVQVACKADVKAVYTTDCKRTRQTVQPLADYQNLQPILYDNIGELVAQVLSDHKGEVVLVAGHSPSVPWIIDELGGDGTSCSPENEFDILCIVTIYESGKAKVVNLQYGEPSPSP